MKLAISHSMVDGFNQCEKKFEYSHIENLEPLSRSQGLNVGIAGHAYFENFFKAVQAGEDVNTAKLKGQLACIEEEQGMIALPLVTKWVDTKWTGFLEDEWELIIVEETLRVDLGELGEFPFTVDLVVRSKSSGKYFMVDHKFLGRFYSEEVMEILPQLPKYTAALEKVRPDIKIEGAIYNLISTRANAKDDALFKTYPMKLSDARKVNAMREQVTTIREIQRVINKERPAVRTANSMNCGYCPFKVLCDAQINNKQDDYDLAKQMLFKENTYGYEYKGE